MSLQFGRQLSLVVATAQGNGIEFGNMRVSFNVRRGDTQTPNSLDARIFNLSADTAKQIQGTEFTQVQLSAGYNPNRDPNVKLPLIFRGTITQARAGRLNQLDSYVDITAGDCDEAYNFAPIAYTIPAANSNQPSVFAQQLQTWLAQKSGVQAIQLNPYQPNFPANQCVRGRVLYGMCRDEMREFGTQNNVKPSLQDGNLTFIPYTSYIPGGSIPLISVATGLIGTPEQTQAGINIRTLLNANIKLGQLIQLKADVNQFRADIGLGAQASNVLLKNFTQLNQDGYYYVMRVDHSGDTREETWYSDLICLSVDATLKDADPINALLGLYKGPINRYGTP